MLRLECTRRPTLVALCAVVFTCPAAASSLQTHPYDLAAPYGVFAMASAGQFTGNGVSSVARTNFGVAEATGDIVLSTGLTPQSAMASYATAPANTSESFAYGSIGLIRLQSQFAHGTPLPARTAAAYGDAGWFDTLTLSSPGLAGLPGQMTFLFYLEGTLFGGLPRGGSTISYTAATDTVFQELFLGVSGAADLVNEYSAALSRQHAVTVNFVWGEPFELMLRGASRVGLGSIFSTLTTGSMSAIDLTLSWGEIQSVTAAGSPVGLYTLVSASGFDYTSSATVPEPSMFYPAALFLAAAYLLRYWRMRRDGKAVRRP